MGFANRKLISKPWYTLITLLIVSVAFENLKVATILGAAIKPTHILAICFVALSMFSERIGKRDSLMGLAFLILPLLSLYRINDRTEWVKAYAIYVLLVSFLVLARKRFMLEFARDYHYYVRLLLFVIAFTQLLGIIQFVSMNLFGYFFLEGFFGQLQFHETMFGVQSGFYRAYSLYHEPSVFGWVTTTSIVIILYTDSSTLTRRKRRSLLILDLVSIVMSISVSALAITIIVLSVYVLIKKGNALNKSWYIMGLLVAAIMLSYYTNILGPLERFREISSKNTSGYERLISPLKYAQATIQIYPVFGRGLGQEGLVDLIGTIGLYSAVNNSLFGIVVYFGLSSLFFLVPAIVLAVRRIKQNRLWLLILLNLLGMYASTGAFVSMDTFIILVLLIAVGQLRIEGEGRQTIMSSRSV